uniref:Uncharacterized protein n=1 Tax=Nelumbo nucifera TaxID=4432 RepID=A0A823A0X2_NELNU|nr:TPA_asm: hypothetical protein HUJ06_019152 [Nelumbo nucifera]
MDVDQYGSNVNGDKFRKSTPTKKACKLQGYTQPQQNEKNKKHLGALPCCTK